MFSLSKLDIIGSSCALAGIEDKYRIVISRPKRKVVVNYPVRMDNG